MSFPNSAGRINLTFEFEGFCLGGGGVYVLGMCVLGVNLGTPSLTRRFTFTLATYSSTCKSNLNYRYSFTRSPYKCDNHMVTPTNDNTFGDSYFWSQKDLVTWTSGDRMIGDR